jgi:hypothetical protein
MAPIASRGKQLTRPVLYGTASFLLYFLLYRDADAKAWPG